MNFDAQLFSEEFHAMLEHTQGIESGFRWRVQNKVESDDIADGNFATYPDHLLELALRLGQTERISDHLLAAAFQSMEDSE